MSAVLLQGNLTNAYNSDHFFCPKVWHRPDHSTKIAEYHKLLLLLFLNKTPSSRPEPVIVFRFVTIVPVISLPKQTSLMFTLFYCA
jgi:hypothetical protein